MRAPRFCSSNRRVHHGCLLSQNPPDERQSEHSAGVCRADHALRYRGDAVRSTVKEETGDVSNKFCWNPTAASPVPDEARTGERT